MVSYWLERSAAPAVRLRDLVVYYFVEPETSAFSIETVVGPSAKDVLSEGRVVKLSFPGSNETLQSGQESAHSFIIHNLDGTLPDSSNDLSLSPCGDPNAKALVCKLLGDEAYLIWGNAPSTHAACSDL
jgi:hypothetical protein